MTRRAAASSGLLPTEAPGRFHVSPRSPDDVTTTGPPSLRRQAKYNRGHSPGIRRMNSQMRFREAPRLVFACNFRVGNDTNRLPAGQSRDEYKANSQDNLSHE